MGTGLFNEVAVVAKQQNIVAMGSVVFVVGSDDSLIASVAVKTTPPQQLQTAALRLSRSGFTVDQGGSSPVHGWEEADNLCDFRP